jgi:hypothetical protein
MFRPWFHCSTERTRQAETALKQQVSRSRSDYAFVSTLVAVKDRQSECRGRVHGRSITSHGEAQPVTRKNGRSRPTTAVEAWPVQGRRKRPIDRRAIKEPPTETRSVINTGFIDNPGLTQRNARRTNRLVAQPIRPTARTANGSESRAISAHTRSLSGTTDQPPRPSPLWPSPPGPAPLDRSWRPVRHQCQAAAPPCRPESPPAPPRSNPAC